MPKPGLLANDSVPCGGAATVEVISPPAHGTIANDIVNDDGSFNYTGTGVDDQFTYQVSCASGMTLCQEPGGGRLCGRCVTQTLSLRLLLKH